VDVAAETWFAIAGGWIGDGISADMSKRKEVHFRRRRGRDGSMVEEEEEECENRFHYLNVFKMRRVKKMPSIY
jgi:hypothetical protein